ncbi:hypothetical protein ACFWDZ_13090, partial [Micromonospora aurantiaca]|uniref:hypothetical protein n=1 Tax=Micromonospora aurantiaca (nom. illeg.) TaxID=47850 RepID=UPI003665A25A
QRTATSTGYKTIGTGFTSTLLSSQRTTTHQPEAPLPAETPVWGNLSNLLGLASVVNLAFEVINLARPDPR